MLIVIHKKASTPNIEEDSLPWCTVFSMSKLVSEHFIEVFSLLSNVLGVVGNKLKFETTSVTSMVDKRSVGWKPLLAVITMVYDYVLIVDNLPAIIYDDLIASIWYVIFIGLINTLICCYDGIRSWATISKVLLHYLTNITQKNLQTAILSKEDF